MDTTLDSTITLQIDILPLDVELTLRYEFYIKQVTQQSISLSDQEDNTSELDCNIPYFT